MSGLSEQELEALHAPTLCDCDDLVNCRTLAALYTDVERIVAAREAALAERIKALPTTRTQAWAKGWFSVSLEDVLREIGGQS